MTRIKRVKLIYSVWQHKNPLISVQTLLSVFQNTDQILCKKQP